MVAAARECPHGSCRRDPGKCLRGVLVDATVIAGTYALLALALDTGGSLSWEGSLTFLAVYVPLALTIKAMDLEYSDQLPRVALFHLSTKMFNVLSSGAI